MITARMLKPVAVFAGIVLAGFVLLTYLLPHHLHADGTSTGYWQTPGSVLVLGLITGVTYGLLGVGLVLIYRSNRIINFAHGQIGAFAAAIFELLVVNAGVPYWIAIFPALAAGGLIGAFSEVAVIRRLRKAPLVMSVVATLGVGQFLALFATVLNSNESGTGFPQPPGLPHFQVGALLVTPAYSAMLILSPLVVIGIGAFLRFSRFGVALRCAADNPEAARMSGIFASRMSSLAWALGGGVAALTAILTAPTQALSQSANFGPSLLEVALAAAVIGRMQSLPVTLVAGAGIGIIEQLLLWNFPQAGFESVVLFGLIVIALLLQRRTSGRGEEKGSWAAVQALPPIPPALRKVWSVRHLGHAVGVVTLAGVLLLPLTFTNADAVQLTTIFALVVVGLSAGIITGLAGQLSLGQFGIASIGAVVSYQVTTRTHDYALAFLYAGLAAAVVSVLIGLPALRVKGLLLTVTTLSFALVVPDWLLNQSWAFGQGVMPGRPSIFGTVLATGKQYYYFGVAILLVALLIARNIRSGGIGRLLVAVRDNEDNARAFTVPASLVKVQGFALAGFLAGIGGAMYAHSLSNVGSNSFTADLSISVMVMTVIGGLGLLTGPLLGALIVFVLPEFGNLGSLALAGTALGQLVIVLYLPGGLAQLVLPIRDRVVKWLGRRAGVDVDAAYLTESGSGAAETSAVRAARPTFFEPAARTPGRGHRPVLVAEGLAKSFGGVHAVREVSLEVRRGETLGLIGPNGAGKTTTFELLAGFTRADAGRVMLHGEDVTAVGPEGRGRRGLIRSFQDAALFPTLTVLECVQLSLERRDPTGFASALLGLTRQERRKEGQARELVSWMGLDRYRSAQIQSLSTGTRRIAEITCLVGLEPEILLLDEPCGGVAQAETEALAELLVQLKRELGLTLCIIEHDIPMIMRIADRIICMAEGQIIAEGEPAAVRHDPRVVESYLGGSLTAIDRSTHTDAREHEDSTAPANRLLETTLIGSPE